MHDFHPHASEVKDVQNEEITCIFSSLAFDLSDANKHVVEHPILSRPSSYLSHDTVGYVNSIRFATKILTDSVRNNVEKWGHYKVVQWKN